MPERQAICPRCGSEIDRLDYNSNIAEWGTCDISGDDMEFTDSETQETDYRCPECNEIVDPYDDDFYPEPDENNEEKPPPPPEEENELISKNTEYYGLHFFICPKCQEKLEVENCNSQEEMECPLCKTKMNKDNVETLNI